MPLKKIEEKKDKKKKPKKMGNPAVTTEYEDARENQAEYNPSWAKSS